MLDGRRLRSRSKSSPCMPPVEPLPEASSSVSRKTQAPFRGVLRPFRLPQVGKLVAEIPSQHRRVLAHPLADALREKDLRTQQMRIRVEIADRTIDEAVARDRPKTALRRLAFERPGRQPVHAAHVSAEQRRHRPQPGLGDRRPSRRRSRRNAPASIEPGSGWKASHIKKKRTTSRPRALIRAMSSAISLRSKRCHMYIALWRGQ